MIVSVFFLAAAADSIVLACKRFVRARTIVLRPSSVWVALTVLLGTLYYWTFRSTESAVETVDKAAEAQLSLSARREPPLE